MMVLGFFGWLYHSLCCFHYNDGITIGHWGGNRAVSFLKKEEKYVKTENYNGIGLAAADVGDAVCRR